MSRPGEPFRQARSAAKHQAILQAARLLFLRDGYARASMEEIAKTATVSTATLYRHFASKAILFEAVVMGSLDALATGPTDPASPPIERLRTLAVSYAVLLCRPETRSLVRMLIAETGDGGELAERFYASVKALLSDTFAHAVAAGIADGVVRPHDTPALSAGHLQGMIEHATLLRGLILGNDTAPLRPPEQIALKAFDVWLAAWGAA